MRILYLYLVAYFLLVFGAAWVLWQSGALTRVSMAWVGLGALIAVALGVLVALTATPRTMTRS